MSERKFLVFEKNLDQLFVRCRICGEPTVDVKKSTVGSMVRVHAECMAGHVDLWHSQPVINQQPVGNILLSAAILLSGGLFSTFYLFASLLNFAFIGKSTFYELQHRILWPVIDKAWHDHVGVVQMLAQGRALRLCGDARCDSPGYSATYGTYTLMDMLDGLICGFSLVQVTETDHNSGAMEKEGLRRLLLQLRRDGLNVSLLATDRSAQIRAMMRRESPTIKHRFDI